ncbi:acetyl-CoA carboxylase biotin carboxyl carrier protein [soil metagenome]
MSENVGSAKAEDNQVETSVKSRRKNAQKRRSNEPSLNMAEIRELADLVDDHGFTDFEFENENIRIRLSKNPAPQFVQGYQPYQTAPVQMSAPPPAETTSASASVEVETVETDSDADLYKIPSPIVGTFYRSPSPDKDPYVKEGSNVSADTVVCIVEAMKLMNEIQAEVAGEVVKIYVENGQPVEYGQPLFGIKK